MGRYWNPSDPAKFGQMTFADVQEAGGRPLTGISHAGHREQLRDDEVIVFYGDRLTHRFVALIPDESEHNDFMEQAIYGNFVAWQFAAMPNTAFARRAAAVV